MFGWFMSHTALVNAKNHRIAWYPGCTSSDPPLGAQKILDNLIDIQLNNGYWILHSHHMGCSGECISIEDKILEMFKGCDGEVDKILEIFVGCHGAVDKLFKGCSGEVDKILEMFKDCDGAVDK